jgi:hypothetical protein
MKFKIIIVYLFLITAAANSLEIGLSQRGFEFGVSGKRHFKIINMYEAEWSEWVLDSRISLLTQWLNLRKARFNVNFSSSVGVGFNWGIPLELGIINIEPEVLIGKNSSLYLRGRLFGIFFPDLGYGPERYINTGLFSPHIVNWRNESDVVIGIRLKLGNTNKKTESEKSGLKYEESTADMR